MAQTGVLSYATAVAPQTLDPCLLPEGLDAIFLLLSC